MAKRSPLKPFVDYRCLPLVMERTAEPILTQLETLEYEGRVEL